MTMIKCIIFSSRFFGSMCSAIRSRNFPGIFAVPFSSSVCHIQAWYHLSINFYQNAMCSTLFVDHRWPHCIVHPTRHQQRNGQSTKQVLSSPSKSEAYAKLSVSAARSVGSKNKTQTKIKCTMQDGPIFAGPFEFRFPFGLYRVKLTPVFVISIIISSSKTRQQLEENFTPRVH